MRWSVEIGTFTLKIAYFNDKTTIFGMFISKFEPSGSRRTGRPVLDCPESRIGRLG